MSFQNKNKKEFENVYHKNKFNVYRIAMDYSGSHKESAEEIFQEVFLKLYTHFDTVDEEYMAAWLVTTTKNTAINYMKKRARECPKADIELFVFGSVLEGICGKCRGACIPQNFTKRKSGLWMDDSGCIVRRK